jgi:Putative transposase/Transposase zinc-binding domain
VAHCEGSTPRRERPELAQILREHAGHVVGLSGEAARVVRELISCRTAVLGGHLQRCTFCGEERPVYNSCRNRHCPKCQSLEQARWVEAQARHLLPVPYFHVVFTLPECLHPLFRRTPTLAYRLLFDAAAQTLLEVARRRLGATPGMIAVLHTWTQTLLYHPHVHLIVTGGGLSLEGTAWMASHPRFFLPVRVLSKVFRGKLLQRFDQALREGRLCIPESLGRPLLGQAAQKPFVVYAKAPMAGPSQVLRYLGRYTHRIAIGNERLVTYGDGTVTFSYKDRRQDGRRKNMTLSVPEFTRRFLLHLVPKRFVRVRHYGLLANRVRAQYLARARALLAAPAPPQPVEGREPWQDLYRRLVGYDPTVCPRCHRGRLITVADLPAQLSPCPDPASSGRSP